MWSAIKGGTRGLVHNGQGSRYFAGWKGGKNGVETADRRGEIFEILVLRGVGGPCQ